MVSLLWNGLNCDISTMRLRNSWAVCGAQHEFNPSVGSQARSYVHGYYSILSNKAGISWKDQMIAIGSVDMTAVTD